MAKFIRESFAELGKVLLDERYLVPPGGSLADKDLCKGGRINLQTVDVQVVLNGKEADRRVYGARRFRRNDRRSRQGPGSSRRSRATRRLSFGPGGTS